jgi:hypothetical protein
LLTPVQVAFGPIDCVGSGGILFMGVADKPEFVIQQRWIAMVGFRAFTAVAGDMLVVLGAGLILVGWEMWLPASAAILTGIFVLFGALTFRR